MYSINTCVRDVPTYSFVDLLMVVRLILYRDMCIEENKERIHIYENERGKHSHVFHPLFTYKN